MTLRIFISHVSEEALEARALKNGLETHLPGVDAFVSAVDIHLGAAWLKEIDDALADARIVLALCSPNSIRRPWLNFESGGGWSRNLPVIPICHKGLRKDRLPDPLRIFQGIELTNAEAWTELVTRLSGEIGIPPDKHVDAEGMFAALQTEPPARGADVGIALCHGQDGWETKTPSIFTMPKSLPSGLQGNWVFRALKDEREFLKPSLHKLSGLILGNPWRATMEPETILAIKDWVTAGGRLLLLGFELGDRHHNGNLADVSHHFGIHPTVDIVGPPGFGDRKPYDISVDFSPAAADVHVFTTGLGTIRLSNVQTVRVDPGGTEWLRVGSNAVYQPRRESVKYQAGTLTTPGGSSFEAKQNVDWLPVAVEAPQGLCGAGGVHMIGTWDLFGRIQPFDGDNLTLASRLFDWLSRKAG